MLTLLKKTSYNSILKAVFLLFSVFLPFYAFAFDPQCTIYNNNNDVNCDNITNKCLYISGTPYQPSDWPDLCTDTSYPVKHESIGVGLYRLVLFNTDFPNEYETVYIDKPIYSDRLYLSAYTANLYIASILTSVNETTGAIMPSLALFMILLAALWFLYRAIKRTMDDSNEIKDITDRMRKKRVKDGL